MKKLEFKSMRSVLGGAGVKKMLAIFVLSMGMTSVGYAQDAIPGVDGDLTTARVEETGIADTSATFESDETVFAGSLMRSPVFGLENAEIASADQPAYRKKYAGLSLFLSYIYPGLGQFYNGEKTKGIIMTSVATVGLVGIVAGITTVNEYGVLSDEGGSIFALGAFIYTVDLLWSMIDAPISSAKINRRNARALSWDTGQGSSFSIQPDFYYATNGLNTKREPVCGMSLKLNF
jgi:TM2 domain-containing membrane protein YozV